MLIYYPLLMHKLSKCIVVYEISDGCDIVFGTSVYLFILSCLCYCFVVILHVYDLYFMLYIP